MKKTFFFIFIILVGACSQNQIEPSYPIDNPALEIAQEWGKNSQLQELSQKQLSANDVELRFWSGFGIRGDRGVILQKENDNWSGKSVEILTCVVLATKNDKYEGQATVPKNFVSDLNCDPGFEKEMIQFADSLVISELPSILNIAQLWSELNQQGISSLPPEVERTDIPPDGHGYVVELKVGDVYRASVLGQGLPIAEADRKVFKIAKLIDQYLGSSIDGSAW